jgi:hypothetical protein
VKLVGNYALTNQRPHAHQDLLKLLTLSSLPEQTKQNTKGPLSTELLLKHSRLSYYSFDAIPKPFLQTGNLQSKPVVTISSGTCFLIISDSCSNVFRSSPEHKINHRCIKNISLKMITLGEISYSLKTQSFLFSHKVQQTVPSKNKITLFILWPLSKRKLSLKSFQLFGIFVQFKASLITDQIKIDEGY